MSNISESVFSFDSCGLRLFGVFCEPFERRSTLALVFLHGWGSYRIGPHRIFVDMARAFAGNGFVSLRFDFRGRGESEGESDKITLLDMITDAHKAVEEATRIPGIDGAVLVGLCSGAEVAAGVAATNPKVRAAILLSAPLLGRQDGANEKISQNTDMAKNYLRKLFLRGTWRKIVSAGVDYKTVFRILLGRTFNGRVMDKNPGNVKEQELAAKFADFQGRCLFVYGGNDPMLPRSEHGYRQLCSGNINATFRTIPEANHNYHSAKWEKELIDIISEWLDNKKTSK
ncbi:MAG: alpha/beta fold hydrolase [Victivallales bacterium]|nr:alpha/beta fold hydrolase [Victivallales bacterium]